MEILIGIAFTVVVVVVVAWRSRRSQPLDPTGCSDSGGSLLFDGGSHSGKHSGGHDGDCAGGSGGDGGGGGD